MSQPTAPPAHIPLQPVTSSNLAAVGYDAPSQCVQVQFKAANGTPGAIWRYHTVPQNVYDGLLAAISMGGYFARHIKNTYPPEKIKG